MSCDLSYFVIKTTEPFENLTACGKLSKRIGLESNNPHGNIDGTNACVADIARITDVFIANAGDVDDSLDHPALFPPWLVRQLIKTYAPPDGIILDPFAGSGTTCL